MLYLDIKGVLDTEHVKFVMAKMGMQEEIFTVENLRKFLADNPNDREITINIDCEGGSVDEGLKIYDELRQSGRVLYTNISGGCHSMGVVVLLAAPAENRSANRNARSLIHRVYTGINDYVTAEDCLDIGEALLMEEDAILDIYADRTGRDRDELQRVMRQEKVHDARSLLSMNFISKINNYNTNQFFNSITKMAEKPKSLADRWRAYTNKFSVKAVNYDYRDREGTVLFQTDTEEDVLAVGDSVTIPTGETDGTFILDDGRIVTIENNVVMDIRMEDTATLIERIEELEEIVIEAMNKITTLETENKSLRGSNHMPKGRQTALPEITSKASGADNRTTADIKAEAREKLAKAKNKSIVKN